MEFQTISSVLELYLGEPLDDALLDWPPDVFAAASILLKLSGGYIHVVNKWPPRAPRKVKRTGGDIHNWNVALRQIGKEWQRAVENGTPPPGEIRDWWLRIRTRKGKRITELFEDVGTCRILLQLVAAADEACADIGIHDP